MNHTPGPWVAECVGTGGQHENPVDVYEVHNGHTRIAEHMTRDDASLVAASLDMLAALEKYISAGFANSTDFYTQAEAYDLARAAIAKAKRAS